MVVNVHRLITGWVNRTLVHLNANRYHPEKIYRRKMNSKIRFKKKKKNACILNG